MSQLEEQRADHVDLPLPPTVVLIAALVIAGVLELAVPTSAGPHAVRMGIGLAVIIESFVWIVLALRAFWDAQADPDPRQPVPSVLTAGIYRVSRNPIYVGFLGILFGMAVCWDSAWFLLALPAMWAFLEFSVIGREEAYLEARFPETYGAYRRRVRRWL